MASVSGSVFAGAGKKDADYLRKVYDAEGKEIEVDIREDEEQNVKLTQTIELLLAAGYFRARIKGLSPFDKVVGGMTWCIQTCNFDIDVDLLFQENSSIGQKIALTEKIVAILPKMKCPHAIEPHQIQGLDFIHIYPVVQWLVKKAIETKEELGDYIRAFSISQFNKTHSTPQDDAFNQRKEKCIESMKHVKDVYKPQRKYRRHDADKLTDEETRVQSTLLEYGRRYGFSKSATTDDENESLAAKKKAVSDGLGSEEEDLAALQEEEERRIRVLMSGMSAMPGQQGKLTASAVGSLVSRQSEQIQQIAAEYADKQAELDRGERADKVTGAQQHQRMMTSMQKQVTQQTARLDEIKLKHDELHKTYIATKEELDKASEYSKKLDTEMGKLDDLADGNHEVLQKLCDLVALNEKLKKQEQEFRANCKEEMAKLQASIEKLKIDGGEESEEDKERSQLIRKQYEADRQKLHKIRMLLARKTREIVSIQRKIDEVPSRAELSQYQRRFIELYNQIAAKYKETKQFYTLYNTQDDTKLYLNKEVNLLNSIHDNFQQAMSSAANKEQFLKQFDQIVEGIKANRNKVEKKKQTEKMRRDQLNDEYLHLVEKQRLYFKTVRDFQEECHKNEILLAKLKKKGYDV